MLAQVEILQGNGLIVLTCGVVLDRVSMMDIGGVHTQQLMKRSVDNKKGTTP